jgi:hypothetical protein
MRPAIGTVSMCACLALGLHARCATLPGSCGNDKVQFDVKTLEHQPAPAPPAEGKAQIVFVENENQMVGFFSDATVRFAMDGAWYGADYGDSYFAVDITPGLHHVCASWQGLLGRKNFDLAPLEAAPGKVYYFAAQVTAGSKSSPAAFSLSQLNDDQGEYRVKAFRRSSWTARIGPKD